MTDVLEICCLSGCEVHGNANRISRFPLRWSTLGAMEGPLVPRGMKVVHHHQPEPLQCRASGIGQPQQEILIIRVMHDNIHHRPTHKPFISSVIYNLNAEDSPQVHCKPSLHVRQG